MNTKSAILAAAIGLVAIAGNTAAFAADDAKSDGTEKCYGISKAGKNDCAGAAHSCQGQGKKDADAREWIKLPKGTCERLVGGTLTAKK